MASDVDTLDVTDVRRYVGQEMPMDQILDPVDFSEIKRYALCNGDDNPLWLDREYASQGPYGDIVAPPTFLRCHRADGPGQIEDVGHIPGVGQWSFLFGGAEWEFGEPVRPGDVIHLRFKLFDVQEKRGRHAGPTVQVTGEWSYERPDGTPYGVCRRYYLRFDNERAKERGKYGQPGDKPECFDVTEPSFWPPYRRGSEVLCGEDVAVGQDLPALLKGPLSVQEIVSGMSVRRLRYVPGRYVFPWTERIFLHWHYIAPESWRTRGVPRSYDAAWTRESWLCQLLTNWIGDHGKVLKMSFQVRRPNLTGDVTTLRGRVTGKSEEAGRILVTVALEATNQDNELSLKGDGTVSLPSRRSS